MDNRFLLKDEYQRKGQADSALSSGGTTVLLGEHNNSPHLAETAWGVFGKFNLNFGFELLFGLSIPRYAIPISKT